jgi:hypothetical protein
MKNALTFFGLDFLRAVQSAARFWSAPALWRLGRGIQKRHRSAALQDASAEENVSNSYVSSRIVEAAKISALTAFAIHISSSFSPFEVV